MLETMSDAMVMDLVKNIWWGIVFIASMYFTTDTIRICYTRWLKVQLKMVKEDEEQ